MHHEENCHKCQSVDFLLFNCPACNHKYCPPHRHAFDHGCSTPSRVQASSSTTTQVALGKTACGFKDCLQVDILTSTCSDCKLIFCLKHRLDVDHECQNSSRKKASESASIAATSSFSPTKVSKAKKSNPKLELMKLKLNSKGNGNIRMEDRAYLSINICCDAKNKTISIFVNKSTQIGRLLDQISSDHGVRCENNMIQPTDAGFLNLYADATDSILPMDLSLQRLFTDGVLYNGCSVSLRRL